VVASTVAAEGACHPERAVSRGPPYVTCASRSVARSSSYAWGDTTPCGTGAEM